MLPFFWYLREHSISKNLSNTEDFLQIKHLIYAMCCRKAYSTTCTIMQSHSPAKNGLFQRQSVLFIMSGKGHYQRIGSVCSKIDQAL